MFITDIIRSMGFNYQYNTGINKVYSKYNNAFNFPISDEQCYFDEYDCLKVKSNDPTEYFMDALSSGGSYWEDDFIRSKKENKNCSTRVKLSRDEQKKLQELVDKYEKYRASLSQEEREYLDKNKRRLFDNRSSKNSWDDFEKLYKSKNYSKMTKEELMNMLHYTDISDTQVDGKIGSFRQGKVGDCWLLSTLNNISNNPEDAETIKNSIKKNANGSYTVKFKGSEKYVEEIANMDAYNRYIDSSAGKKIEEEFSKKYSGEETATGAGYKKILYNQDYTPQNEKEKYYAELVAKYKDDKELNAIRSDREKFIKEKNELLKDGITISEQRLRENSTKNANGEDVQYSTGDNDVTLIEMAVDDTIKKVSDERLDGGSTRMANLLLLGKETESYEQEPTAKELIELEEKVKKGEITQEEFEKLRYHSPVSGERKQKWIDTLENTDSSRLVASSVAGSDEDIKNFKTNPDGMMMKLESSELGTRRICKSHVYNIARVDREKKIIYLENPWESKVQIPLTYEEYFKCFHSMSITEK